MVSVLPHAWFYADSPASDSVTYSNQGWSARIVYSSSHESAWFDPTPSTIGNLTIQVLKVDSNGNYTVIADQMKKVPAGQKNAVLVFNSINADTISTIDFNPNVDRLAVRLFARIEGGDGFDKDWMLVSINGCDGTSMTSPSGSPPYPTSQLPTIAMMSIGFVGLGSCIWFNKRKVVEVVS